MRALGAELIEHGEGFPGRARASPRRSPRTRRAHYAPRSTPIWCAAWRATGWSSSVTSHAARHLRVFVPIGLGSGKNLRPCGGARPRASPRASSAWCRRTRRPTGCRSISGRARRSAGEHATRRRHGSPRGGAGAGHSSAARSTNRQRERRRSRTGHARPLCRHANDSPKAGGAAYGAAVAARALGRLPRRPRAQRRQRGQRSVRARAFSAPGPPTALR